MVEKNNKNIWLAVAAAGLLIGGAILFHYATASNVEEEEEENNIRDLLEEQGLLTPKKQGRSLDPQYFLKLLQCIGEQAKAKTAKLGLTSERRKAFKDKNDALYKEIVSKEL